MKKTLLIALATLFIANFAYASDYIGVYFDTAHMICTKDAVGDVAFYYYVWAKPASLGLSAVEFKIVFPPMVYDMGAMTLNAGINLTLGDLLTGWSATFASCQPGTIWIQVYRQRVYVDTALEGTGVIQLAKADDSQNLGLSTCEMMDASFTVLNHGFINLPCIIGTKDASWGAIKSLF
jgi:hypothetical protein